MSPDKQVRPAVTDLDQQVEDTVRTAVMGHWDQAMTEFFGRLDKLADLHAVGDQDMVKLVDHLFGSDVSDEYQQYLEEG